MWLWMRGWEGNIYGYWGTRVLSHRKDFFGSLGDWHLLCYIESAKHTRHLLSGNILIPQIDHVVGVYVSVNLLFVHHWLAYPIFLLHRRSAFLGGEGSRLRMRLCKQPRYKLPESMRSSYAASPASTT